MIFTTDDLCLENLQHFHHWDVIKALKPELKLIAFTIANYKGEQKINESDKFKTWWEEHKDWVEIGVHGYDHMGPPEQERPDAKELVQKSLEILDPFLPCTPIYRPPGFQRTLKTEPMLKKLGLGGIAYKTKIRYFDNDKIEIGLLNSHCTNKYEYPITAWQKWLTWEMLQSFSLTSQFMPDHDIFIGIPNRGTLTTELASNLAVWERNENVCCFKPYGLFPLDAARNYIVKEFLETNCKYLWWIDDDIVPPVGALEKLHNRMETNPNIAALGATCFVMKNEPGQYFPYPPTLRYNKNKEYEVYYGKGVETVDATGGGCVMVRREVYESIEKPYEFKYHADGTLELTCDFNVWQKAEKAGFALYVDFGLLCDHNRTCSLMGVQSEMAKMLNAKE